MKNQNLVTITLIYLTFAVQFSVIKKFCFLNKKGFVNIGTQIFLKNKEM